MYGLKAHLPCKRKLEYYMRYGWILLALTLITGCASNDKIDESKSEKELYETAEKSIRSSNYPNAIKHLQALETRYPFGPYAEQAQLELIYAYYRNYDLEEAHAAADRFIQLHPQHPHVDYAYYLKGLSSFSEGKGIFERFMPTDMTRRDPGPARESFAEFSQLLNRYPHSAYAPDARVRMIYLRNLLARYEIHVANYYFKRKAYLAAANRGRNVVENYPGSPAVADGLAVMVQGYNLLGMNDLASDALKVLVANYPQHPSLDSEGNFLSSYTVTDPEPSWTNRLTLGLFDRHELPEFNYDPTGTENGKAPPRPDEVAPENESKAENTTEDAPVTGWRRWFDWF